MNQISSEMTNKKFVAKY